jgi:pyrroline-5-carboxylate reductase
LASIGYFCANGKGAAEMLMEEQPRAINRSVTTPKGCTIAGLNEMEMHGFSSSNTRYKNFFKTDSRLIFDGVFFFLI